MTIEMIDQDELGQKIIRRLGQMKDVRRGYETGLWDDITRLGNPRRAGVTDGSHSLLKGRRRGQDVYDGTPLGALNTWRDGMQGFLVSESLNWFRSEMEMRWLNDIPDVRSWLQQYDEAMYSGFQRSNFYAVLGEYFGDAGSIGTATLFTEEDVANKRENHIAVHPREVFISENRHGDVDTVFREFEKTGRQALAEYGAAAFSDAFVETAQRQPEVRHLFIHAVFPNDSWSKGSLAPTRRKFNSIHVHVRGTETIRQKGKVVRRGGFDLNPYAVWRFRKNSDEIYGYSPMADAIVEVFALNQFAKTMMQAAHMSVDPPYNVPSELRGAVKIKPHGYNFYEDESRRVTPVMTGINYPIGKDEMDRLKTLIDDKFRVDFFLTLSRATREMTATEIYERQSEKAVLMGPQIDRLTHEGLAKIFDIVSHIEDRAGRLPPAPAIVEESGAAININFVGPLAQAQKRLFKMQPIRNAINELAPMASVFGPSILYRVKEHELSQEILESANFPQHLIRSDDEVAAMVERDEAAQAAAQQQQALGDMASAVPKLSKEPGAGSPMEALMNEGAIGGQ